MSDVSPADKFFGSIFLDDEGLHFVYPNAGTKRIDEIVWYVKSRDAYEIVTVGYEDGTDQTIIHYFGDTINTNPTKKIKFVQPQVASGDVLVLRAGELQSVIFRENLPDAAEDAILQAILKKIVKIKYVKQNEE
jgi:hypothetical protein